MAKIVTRAGLNVGTELIIDEPNRTYQLVVAGNLIAKDGVSLQALYSKFVDLWATATYQDSPFPMNTLDALSGQYQIGIDDAGNPNGWKPLDAATRRMHRDGGWDEYDATGTLLRVYTGVVGLGVVSTGSQLYFTRTPTEAPTNFTFKDQCNEGIQVYGDVNNGNFDNRTFFKAYVREQGKTYKDSILADTGKETKGTGSYIVNMLLSNGNDLNITAVDTAMTAAPYNNIVVTYYTTNQARLIGGINRNFKVIVNGNGATLEQIYTKLQYLLRQSTDIDSGAGTVIGKTADLLANFVGSTLETTTGVYIDNIQNADSNRIKFKDVTGVFRINPFVSSGIMSFNSIMIGANSVYRLMYATGYGTSAAVTVNDAAGVQITGVITSGTISFTYDYENDTAGGGANIDKNVVLVGVNPNSSKFAVTTGTLTRSKAIALSLVASADRAYI